MTGYTHPNNPPRSAVLTTQAASVPLNDTEQAIYRTLLLMVPPDAVVEVRALNTKRGTQSGYYDDLDKLSKEAARLDGQVDAIYITLNPVDPTLKARASNRIKEYARETTSDANILTRRRLLIDFDPTRPSGISSTDEEHRAALRLAKECRQYLGELGFPAPIFADSGNGGHLIYAIEMPNDAEAATLLSQCLAALDFTFSNEEVKVDRTTYNAARISKLYGTMACKGDSTDDRPHRRARILRAPETLDPVPVELLHKLAGLAPVESVPAYNSNGSKPFGAIFDLQNWLVEHNIPVLRESPWQGGRKWILERCLWNPAHNDKSAYILQLANGAIAAGCHHDSCGGKSWADLRVIYDGPLHGGNRLSAQQQGTYTRQELSTKQEQGSGSALSIVPETAIPERLPGIVCLADVQPEEVRWVWPGRIPLGKLTILDGDPGLGKSVISIDLASRLSQGSAMPDGSIGDICNPCGTVLLSAEDGPADTIRPRLDAMGADSNRVVALRSVIDPDGSVRDPTVADIADIERAIKLVDAKAVFIDPIMAYLPDQVESKTDHSVRRSLKPLADLAERTGAAVVVLRHLNKAPGGNPLYRGGGSIAFIGAARSGMLVAKDPNDETGVRHVLAMTKSNIARPAPSLAYHLEGADNGSVKIVWDGVINHTASTILSTMEPEERSAMSEAVVFLETELKDGERKSEELKASAKSAGIAETTLQRAKRSMGIDSVKYGVGREGYWVWVLPTSNKEQPSPKKNEPQSTSDDAMIVERDY